MGRVGGPGRRRRPRSPTAARCPAASANHSRQASITERLISTAVVGMPSVTWQKRVIVAGAEAELQRAHVVPGVGRVAVGLRRATAARPACAAHIRVRSPAACGSASRPAPTACRGAGNARRRTRTASPARARGAWLRARRLARFGWQAASCHAMFGQGRAPGRELAVERPARIGRAGRRQAQHRHAERLGDAAVARRFAAVVGDRLQRGASRRRLARSFSSACSIALSRLPSRRQLA